MHMHYDSWQKKALRLSTLYLIETHLWHVALKTISKGTTKEKAARRKYVGHLLLL